MLFISFLASRRNSSIKSMRHPPGLKFYNPLQQLAGLSSVVSRLYGLLGRHGSPRLFRVGVPCSDGSGLVPWRVQSTFLSTRLLGWPGRPKKGMGNDIRCLSLLNIKGRYKRNTNITTFRSFTKKRPSNSSPKFLVGWSLSRWLQLASSNGSFNFHFMFQKFNLSYGLQLVSVPICLIPHLYSTKQNVFWMTCTPNIHGTLLATN